jgi:hypothetical protein
MSDKTPQAMGSTPVGRRAGRGEVISYGEGRVCSEPTCSTKLSRYNGTAQCGAHGGASGGAKHWTP